MENYELIVKREELIFILSDCCATVFPVGPPREDMKEKTMKIFRSKWFWITLVIIGVLLFAACCGMGYYFINYAMSRHDTIDPAMMPNPKTPEEINSMNIIKANRKAFNDLDAAWYPEQNIEKMTITNPEGFKLAAKMIYADDPKTHNYVILCHGYQCKGDWMMPHAYVFHQWGFNTLLVDWKSHGESEGKWIGMGWKDKDDLMLWIDEVLKKDPEANIVLLGISMGGATVLNASGMEELSDHVVAIIDDCGYTNVWDAFADQMKTLYNIPAFPLMHSASMMNSRINGFGFKEADSVKQLRKADPDLPMLFIYGENDAFVPLHMLDEVYDAKRGIKEKLIVPDTDHGNSYCREPELYFTTIKSFLEKYTDLM